MTKQAANTPATKKIGRPKGSPNRATADVRAAIALLAQQNVGRCQKWLDQVAKKDPAKAFDLYLKMLEHHIPKLARTEFSVPPPAGAGGTSEVIFRVKRG